MNDKYKIEIGEEEKSIECLEKGTKDSVGHGFIYKNGDAYAIYMVGWSPARIEKKVSVAISIGDFDDDARIEDRTCFGVEVFPTGEEISFSFIDPEFSPWAKTESLGIMISKEEARSHPFKSELFLILEHALRNHKPVSDYLEMN